MSRWPSVKARVVLGSLLRIGWKVKRHTRGSHRTLSRPGWPDYTWAFHGGEEIGPKMLTRIAKRTGLTPEDL
jgi:predicted RNA binding protein YcfA (HicA-like mRNA interferase family)